MDFLNLFQGIGTLFATHPTVSILRLLLVVLGIILVYLGAKKVLEPLIMVPMGFGMIAVNAGVLFLSADKTGTLFMDAMASDPLELMTLLQIDFLQPIYNFTFSNGLIACLVFMGIGVITDIGFIISKPFTSFFIAICAELGTILTFPIAKAFGFSSGEAAAIALIGGADGPMVLYTAITLAEDLVVPITVVAYLYLSLTYGLYPYLLRLLIPKSIRGTAIKEAPPHSISSKKKLTFAIAGNTLLCFLFPVAAPLFLSFFLGVAIREIGIEKYTKLIEDGFLYGATFFLGLILGVLCDASTILNPKVIPLFALGLIALLLSGIGGIIGGYIIYFLRGKNFNPLIGIAGVSCVPTTAKVAQKEAHAVNKHAFILQYAMGANICGVITTAILTGIYVTLLK